MDSFFRQICLFSNASASVFLSSFLLPLTLIFMCREIVCRQWHGGTHSTVHLDATDDCLQHWNDAVVRFHMSLWTNHDCRFQCRQMKGNVCASAWCINSSLNFILKAISFLRPSRNEWNVLPTRIFHFAWMVFTWCMRYPLQTYLLDCWLHRRMSLTWKNYFACYCLDSMTATTTTTAEHEFWAAHSDWHVLSAIVGSAVNKKEYCSQTERLNTVSTRFFGMFPLPKANENIYGDDAQYMAVSDDAQKYGFLSCHFWESYCLLTPFKMERNKCNEFFCFESSFSAIDTTMNGVLYLFPESHNSIGVWHQWNSITTYYIGVWILLYSLLNTYQSSIE